MEDDTKLLVTHTVPEFCIASLIASHLGSQSAPYPILLEQNLQPYTQDLLEEVAHCELDSSLVEQYFSQNSKALDIDSSNSEHIPLLFYLSMVMNIPPEPSSVKKFIGEVPHTHDKHIHTVEVGTHSQYLELLKSFSHVDCSKMVVTWGNQPSAIAGAFYAYLKGASFFTISNVEELEQLWRTLTPEWITFLTSVDMFSLPLVLNLYEYQLSSFDVDKNAFSVLTARNLPALSRMIYKTQNPHHEWKHEGVLLMLEDRSIDSDDPDTSIFIRKTGTADTVRSLSEKGMQVLNMIINGLNMHYKLEDGAICGGYYNEEPSITEPPCKGNGKLECDLYDDYVNAQDIRANHVLGDSCSNVFPYSGEFGKDFNVFLNFLDGYACSFIGTLRLKLEAVHEAPLYHQLIRSGHTMGQIINILNRSYLYMPFDYPTYVLFGDPETTVAPPDHGSWTAHIEEKEGEFHITLTDVDAPIVHLTLSDPSLLTSAMEGKVYVKCRTPTRMTVYYIVLPDQQHEQLHIFIYGWSRLVCEELIIEVTDEPPLSEEMRRVLNDNLKYMRRSHLYKVKSSKLSGMIKDYENFMGTMGPPLAECKYNAQAYRVVEKKVKKLHRRLQGIWQEIRGRVQHMGDDCFMDVYKPPFSTIRTSVPNLTCPYCGDPLIEKIMAHTVEEGEIRRSFICPKCLVVSDSPAGKIIMVNPVIGGNPKIGESELLYVAGDMDFTVTFVNDTEIPSIGIVFCRITEAPSDRKKEFIITPDYYEFSLEPGEKKMWEFTVSIPENIPRFLIFTYVFSNNQVYWGEKYFSNANVEILNTF
jgi:hypothetical protein